MYENYYYYYYYIVYGINTIILNMNACCVYIVHCDESSNASPWLSAHNGFKVSPQSCVVLQLQCKQFC